nr:MAG TPA: hypothetical protein [Inoviridae sp.]
MGIKGPQLADGRSEQDLANEKKLCCVLDNSNTFQSRGKLKSELQCQND